MGKKNGITYRYKEFGNHETVRPSVRITYVPLPLQVSRCEISLPISPAFRPKIEWPRGIL